MNRILVGVGALVVGGLGGYAVASTGGATPVEAEQNAECSVSEYAMGLRWQQQSAEAQALQGQTYKLAAERLDEIVEEADDDANLAIISDLDETALDNSDLLARDMKHCHDFSTWDTWAHWEREGDPRLIPGAKEFFDHADKLGVDIYYISDRTEENLDATLEDLKSLKLPQASEDNVLLLGPPKQERRESVTEEHTLVMQLGDTLHDFDEGFADAKLADSRKLVEKNADKFGSEWFVLPNPTYGSWSDAKLSTWDAPLETE